MEECHQGTKENLVPEKLNISPLTQQHGSAKRTFGIILFFSFPIGTGLFSFLPWSMVIFVRSVYGLSRFHPLSKELCPSFAFHNKGRKTGYSGSKRKRA